MTILFDRRSVAAGLGAFGATAALGAPRMHKKIEGLTTWSESAMVLYFDPELRNGFSFRLSRYPDLGTTWLWCHVIQDGAFFGYTNQFLPSTTHHVTADQDPAVYDVPGMAVRIVRTGPADSARLVSFSARVRAHRGDAARDGDGPVLVDLSGVFHPNQAAHGNTLPGRYERTGLVEAELNVAGRSVSLSGMAKAHEQTQTAPRFMPSFTYAMLWGQEASLIGLLTKTVSLGDVEIGGADRAIAKFAVEKWSPRRKFLATLKDGSTVDGVAETRFSYRVPVFDKLWNGNVVRARIGTHEAVGMINDWKPDEQPYGL